MRGLVIQFDDGTRTGVDGLQLTSTALVPEVRLFLAEDPTILWARLEAETCRSLAAPFWASAWSGGQALARYVLDHPGTVADRRVLDLASGSGIVAIAAALAGAAAVTANDIDPFAGVAIEANADANGVRIDVLYTDLFTTTWPSLSEHTVVLAGDVLYSESMAAHFVPFLERLAEGGAQVLLGDPGRGWMPSESWVTLAAYQLPSTARGEDSQFTSATVLTPTGSRPDR
jgi:predicted nicotinamide N-methyase